MLDEEVTTDRFFNFVITGYSLVDWVGRDPALAGVDIQALRSDPTLKVCGDLANASKHFELDKRVPITKSASSAQGWGLGRYGHGGYGIGEEKITVELNDGTRISCLDFVQQVLVVWRTLFP